MKSNALAHNLAWLDAVRILCVLLVMYGHYASVGGYAKDIPGIVSQSVQLPLMNGIGIVPLQFDGVLIRWFSTQSAILGVALFFMVTGYLMPKMLERYSRAGFLINRFFRIFPCLAAGSLAIGAFVHYAQGLPVSLAQYAASMSLTYLFVGVAPVTGVLWTLCIEVLY